MLVWIICNPVYNIYYDHFSIIMQSLQSINYTPSAMWLYLRARLSLVCDWWKCLRAWLLFFLVMGEINIFLLENYSIAALCPRDCLVHPKTPMNRYRDIFAAGLYLNHAFEDARNAPSTFIQWSADGRAEMTLGTQGIDLEIFQESTVVIHTEVLKCAPYS